MWTAGSSARCAVLGAFVHGIGHRDSLSLDLMMGDGTSQSVVPGFIFVVFCSFSV